MWPFRQIRDWFMASTEYRDCLNALVQYLPFGDLDILVAWVNRHIPYRPDTDPDRLDNFNGADLTIRARGGDCESIAAVYVEVLRCWTGWESHHVCMLYEDGTAHDVAMFQDPGGNVGWIDGKVFWGTYMDMRMHYRHRGWVIRDWWVVNDMGVPIKEIQS